MKHALTPDDINDCFERHLPYKLGMLRTWLRVYEKPKSLQVDCDFLRHIFHATIETAAVHARLFLHFLGVTVKIAEENGAKCRKLVPYDPRSDDLMVTALGGKCVEIGQIQKKDAELVAIFLEGTNKACAHFTLNSGHKFDWNDLPTVISLVEGWLRSNLYDVVGRAYPDVGLWP